VLLLRFSLLTLAFLAGPALAEVHVSSAWIRALPPTQPVTAAYLEVMNHGQEPVTITGARVEGAGRVEIHTSEEVDGLVRMVQLDTVSMAPGETLSLAPGGMHLMLFEMSAMPRSGESRKICLLFASGEETCADAEVRKSAQESQHEHHQHH
jgi:copper(I)-binding protein